MDIDIAKMFQEKNKDILKNSLALEMGRNLDSLKKTTDNCTALEMNKILLFLKDFFEEHKIKYQEEDLKKLLEEEKDTLNDIVNRNIEQKKENLHSFFDDPKEQEGTITESYFDSYYEVLATNTKELLEIVSVEIKKEVCMNFTPKLLKKYKLTTTEQKERIASRIDSLFTETLIRRVKEQFEFRDESLKNMCKESFEKYLKLNETAVEKK